MATPPEVLTAGAAASGVSGLLLGPLVAGVEGGLPWAPAPAAPAAGVGVLAGPLAAGFGVLWSLWSMTPPGTLGAGATGAGATGAGAGAGAGAGPGLVQTGLLDAPPVAGAAPCWPPVAGVGAGLVQTLSPEEPAGADPEGAVPPPLVEGGLVHTGLLEELVEPLPAFTTTPLSPPTSTEAPPDPVTPWPT